MWGCGLSRRWGACFFLIGCRCSVVSNSLRPRGLHHPRLCCPLLSPGVCSNSCLLSQWCHPTISSLSLHFSSYLQSFPASGSFPVSWLSWLKYWSLTFSISPSNEYSGLISFRIDWFGLFAVQGLSRVFSSTRIRKHQFLDSQPSLWSSSYVCTWLLEKP